ncbi:aspartate/glutamate racemase family protein [Alteribacillus sp. HJP-4]|uniref:aspartate/glutamate racemase family protein n=1 Tax=Alteribacillus sp. HJP-4 TaxID=2775394 RepID=UPI0035CD1DD0
MKNTIAIIHTTPVTIEPLTQLAKEVVLDCEIINIMDDSILSQIKANDGRVKDVTERLIQYAVQAERAGADIVLNACSSVGSVVQHIRKYVSVPVVRIDEAMAEEAVKRGTNIGVAATLSTTLTPTLELLKEKAGPENKTFTSELASKAYDYLMEGDKEKHDAELTALLGRMAEELDVVVLAQASMARVVKELPDRTQKQFLSSPEAGMKRVKAELERVNA